MDSSSRVDAERRALGTRNPELNSGLSTQHSALKPGLTASVEFVVDETMLAGFGGHVIHRVLSTAALVYYLEWAGRKLIEPHLKEHEQGIGHAISIVHRSPAHPGATVTATATLTSYTGNRVVTAVEARTSDGALIADGEFTQVLLPKDVVAKLFAGVTE